MPIMPAGAGLELDMLKYSRLNLFAHGRPIARRLAAWAAGLGLLIALPAQAGLGMTRIEARDGRPPVVVYYPSPAPEQRQDYAPMHPSLAVDAELGPLNGRLIVISHGSGGSAWVHEQLARRLTAAGFVAAMPEHDGDNQRDPWRPGPESWKKRPREVSQAIDAVAEDPRFGPLLQLDRVGGYGMSAGGHTMLSLAGGRWSPQRFLAHCQAHLLEDFPACVGVVLRQRGNWLDGIKAWLARQVLEMRFDGDTQEQVHTDPRLAALVAAVPAAADFDMQSLQHPRVPLALLTAAQDAWLKPRFHADQVLAHCLDCLHLGDLPKGGHGAYLAPLPDGLDGLLGELLNDPAGFQRSQTLEMDERVLQFFLRQLQPLH